MNSRTKFFHVHYKDIKVYPDKLDDVGIMAYPLDFMSPKLPGLGDVDWGKIRVRADRTSDMTGTPV